MYVLGRGTSGLGTVLPALAQASKTLPIENVTVCSTSLRRTEDVTHTAAAINERLATALNVTHAVWPELRTNLDVLSAYDCAIVSVPDDKHFEVGQTLLESNLHCLMVKPLTPSMKEAAQLVAIAEERRLYGAVEFHKRFDEANLVVRRMIHEGRLGQLAYATVEYSQRITVPRDFFAAWASRTNCFQYLGVHYVDLLHFMTGFTPVRLIAVGRRGVLSALGIDTYDSVHVTVEWQPTNLSSTFVSQFCVGWIDPERSSAMSDQRYLLVGAQGRIECDQKNRGVRLVGATSGVEDLNPYFSDYLAGPEDALDFGGYGFRSIETFLTDVTRLKAGIIRPNDLEGHRPTFRSALVSTAVLEAVGLSLADGNVWRTVDEISR
jgi:predicted dehydrogenase